MSKTINLDLQIENIEGELVKETKNVKKDGEDVLNKDGSKEEERVPLTLKQVLITLLPVYPDKSKMVDIWDLGLKIRKAKGKTEFDNDELSLVREVIELNSYPNPMQQGGKDTIDRYFPFIVAQLLKYLDEIKVSEPEKSN